MGIPAAFPQGRAPRQGAGDLPRAARPRNHQALAQDRPACLLVLAQGSPCLVSGPAGEEPENAKAEDRAKAPAKLRPKRAPGDHYTVHAYDHAIRRGCELAYGMPKQLRNIPTAAKVASGKAGMDAAQRERLLGQAEAWRQQHCWHPNQLRHTAATRIRAAYGIELARIILGRSSAVTSEIYADIDREKADEHQGLTGRRKRASGKIRAGRWACKDRAWVCSSKARIYHRMAGRSDEASACSSRARKCHCREDTPGRASASGNNGRLCIGPFRKELMTQWRLWPRGRRPLRSRPTC